MRFFTYTLSSSTLYINGTGGASFLSVLCSTGASCSVQGNLSFQGLQSTAITITENQGFSLSAPPTSSLDGITLTSTGAVDIIIGL
jgi:hypothetical protein